MTTTAPNIATPLPAALLPLIRASEGRRLRAYLCPAGRWSIGYGHTGADVAAGMIWTDAQVDAALAADAAAAVRDVQRLCPRLTAPDHIAAIADFVYNFGAGRLASSALRARLNARDLAGARAELARWCHSAGEVLPGLVARRAAEAALLR